MCLIFQGAGAIRAFETLGAFEVLEASGTIESTSIMHSGLL